MCDFVSTDRLLFEIPFLNQSPSCSLEKSVDEMNEEISHEVIVGFEIFGPMVEEEEIHEGVAHELEELDDCGDLSRTSEYELNGVANSTRAQCEAFISKFDGLEDEVRDLKKELEEEKKKSSRVPGLELEMDRLKKNVKVMKKDAEKMTKEKCLLLSKLKQTKSKVDSEDVDGLVMYRDGLKEINKRIARGEHAEVLLLKPRLKDGVVVKSKKLEIGEATIRRCVDVSGNEFTSFVFNLCSAVWKKEGAQYFTLDGSRRSKTELCTLPLPSDYVSDFINLLVTHGVENKLKLPCMYRNKSKGIQKEILYYKCGKKTVSGWLTKLRKKFRPKKASVKTSYSEMELDNDDSNGGE